MSSTLSKEEAMKHDDKFNIIVKNRSRFEKDELRYDSDKIPLYTAFRAMDEYAQKESRKEAIAFADFAEKNFSFSFGSYSPLDVNLYPTDDLTTDQLYDLYLQSKQKQK